jgi:hypothetical protein
VSLSAASDFFPRILEILGLQHINARELSIQAGTSGPVLIVVTLAATEEQTDAMADFLGTEEVNQTSSTPESITFRVGPQVVGAAVPATSLILASRRTSSYMLRVIRHDRNEAWFNDRVLMDGCTREAAEGRAGFIITAGTDVHNIEMWEGATHLATWNKDGSLIYRRGEDDHWNTGRWIY